MTIRTVFAVAVAVLGIGGVTGLSQGRPQESPRVLIDSLAGRDSFNLYCASCHGDRGQGDGAVAEELRTRPADLTTLALRNDGAFPRDRVRNIIAGKGGTLIAHGTTEMPVWGPMFRVFESDARVRERIENLLTHLQSLQKPSTGVNDPGAQAFRTYCASCHGTSARGNGPMADQLRHAPPDLTKFSARNGGVFPSVRLTRIIDGRDVAAHGDREMPVWGDAFKSTQGGYSRQQVDDRIAAVVRYLQGIQERGAE